MLLNKETVKKIPYDSLVSMAGNLLESDNYAAVAIVDAEIARRDEIRARRETADANE